MAEEVTTIVSADARTAAAAPSRPDPLAHVLAWAALAAAYTAMVVRYSIARGKLLVPMTYDDVTYLRDALAKLDGFYRGGLNGLLGEYINHPPHSPLATGIAFLGYVIFGTHDWAPYAANAVLIFALLGLTDYLTRGLRPWQKLAAFLFVLTVPVVTHMVYEFRPDMAVGMLSAATIVLLIEKPLVRHATRTLIGFGLLIAVTLVAKPSVFPVTLGLAGLALGAAGLRDRLLLGREASGRALARVAMLVLVPAILIPLPHYVHNRREILDYLTTNSLGPNREIWKLHADLLTHLRYFSSGYGGSIMLGRHFRLMMLVLMVGAVAALLFRRQKPTMLRAACYTFMLLVAYMGPTCNEVKTQFLATPFDFLLIFVVLLVIRGLLRVTPPPKPARCVMHGLLIALVIAAAWDARWPLYWGKRHRPDVETRNAYMRDLYHEIRSNSPAGESMVYLAVMGYFVNTDAFGYLADKDGVTQIDFVTDPTNRDLAAFTAALDHSEFVIIGDPENPEDVQSVPCSQILSKTLPLIRARSDYRVLATCPAAAGKNYYLFRHVPALK